MFLRKNIVSWLIELPLILLIFFPITTWADYFVHPKTVDLGGGTWGSILTMDASISGKNLSLQVKKTDQTPFQAGGNININHGTYNSNDRLTGKTFSAGTKSININLDLTKLSQYPYDMYAHVINNDGDAWVGAIKLNYTVTNNSPPSPPVISPSPASGIQNQPITIEIRRGIDPDGDLVKYQCTAEYSNYEDKSFDSNLGTGNTIVSPQFVFNTSGEHKITCKSFDEEGQGSNEVSRNITITSSSGSTEKLSFEIDDLEINSGQIFSHPFILTGGSPPYQVTINTQSGVKFTSGKPIIDLENRRIKCSNNSQCQVPVIADEYDYSYIEFRVSDSNGNLKFGQFKIKVFGNPSPIVSAFTPSTVSFEEVATFNFQGENLPTDNTLAVWVADCKDPTFLPNRTSTSQSFTCTPLSSGIKNYIVKYKAENSPEVILKEGNITVSAARPTPVDGQCGSANGKSYLATDLGYGSDTQCSAGTPNNTTFPETGKSISWTCLGIDGGTSASCSASRQNAVQSINGQCGTENGKNYSSNITNWESENFCSVGTAAPSNPAFPNTTQPTTQWSCQGSNGGTDATCSANRASSNITVNSIMPNKIRANRTTNILVNGDNLPEEINVSLDGKSCRAEGQKPYYIFSCAPISENNNATLLVTDTNGNPIIGSSSESLSMKVVNEGVTENVITILPLFSSKIPLLGRDDLRGYMQDAVESFKKQLINHRIHFIESASDLIIDESPYLIDAEKQTAGGSDYISMKKYVENINKSLKIEKARIENKADVVYVFSDSLLGDVSLSSNSLSINDGSAFKIPRSLKQINKNTVVAMRFNMGSYSKKPYKDIITHELGHLLSLHHGHLDENHQHIYIRINGEVKRYGKGYCDTASGYSTIMYYRQKCGRKSTGLYSKNIGCDDNNENCIPTHDSIGIIEITAPELASHYLN